LAAFENHKCRGKVEKVEKSSAMSIIHTQE